MDESVAGDRGRRRVRALVTGRVQGVGFRYSAQYEAGELGLTGWVRNLSDGRAVQLEAEGPAPVVDALLDWLQRGPRWARVERVVSAEIPLVGDRGFEILSDL